MSANKERELTEQSEVIGKRKNGKAGSFINNVSLFIIRKLKLVFSLISVEPYMFCYVLAQELLNYALFELRIIKACRADLNYPENICDKLFADVNDTTIDKAYEEVGHLIANVDTWNTPVTSIGPIVSLLFLGAWSDKTGNRRALLLVPSIGAIISSCLLMISSYYLTEVSLNVTMLFGNLLRALCGGLPLVLLGSYSYLADVTSVDARTFRIGIATIVAARSLPVATSIAASLIKSFDYMTVFGISLFINLLGLIAVWLKVHDKRRNDIKGTYLSNFITFINPKNAWDTLMLLIMSRGRKLALLGLIILVHIILLGPVYGRVLTIQSVLENINMNVDEIKSFENYCIVIGMTGTSTALTVFSRFLKWSDALLGIIASICRILANIVYFVAPDKHWFLVGPLVDIFGPLATILARALGSKVVEPTEVGKMFSLLAVAEMFANTVYPKMFWELNSTIGETFPRIIYVAGLVMSVPAIAIFILLFFLTKKQPSRVMEDPIAKGKNTQDNDITYF